jgi:hypothetical protein
MWRPESAPAGDPVDATASVARFYYGTLAPLPPGATRGPMFSRYRRADAILDAVRPAGAGLRTTAVSAATSVKDATAIAAIRSYSAATYNPFLPVDPYSAIHVYRVELVPFHSAPVALLEELQDRLIMGGTHEALVQEYWEPTVGWRLREVLATSFTVVEKLAASTERDTYLRRWVHYNLDR